MRTTTDNERFETASGNVFADLDLPDPDIALKKAELAAKIAERIEHNGWSQVKAAVVMGIDQPKVSTIIRGRLSDFSLERLIICLEKLGQSVRFVYSNAGQPSRSTQQIDSRSEVSGTKRAKSKKKKVRVA